MNDREEVYSLIEEHYRKNRDKLVKGFIGLARNRQGAEDIVQEAYARACQYWNSFKVAGNFDNWFSSILQNCVRDFKRSSYAGALSTEELRNEPVLVLKRDQLDKLWLENKIKEKPENVRTILYLYLFEGYTSYEIEQIVPEKAPAIRKMVERFRREMRE